MGDAQLHPQAALVSVVLGLRALKDDLQPRSLGHAAKKVLLLALGEPAASQAEACQPFKPYTASTLLAIAKTRLIPASGVSAGEDYLLRFSVLTPWLVEALAQALSAGSLRSGGELVLDGIPFHIFASTADRQEHILAGQTDYRSLAYPAWSGAVPTAEPVTIEFITPTFFSRPGGLYSPIPLPELLFGSLAERWNQFGILALPDDLRQVLQAEAVISRYELHSAAAQYKGGSVKIGALGRAAYAFPRLDGSYGAILSLLADFSLYSGAGQMTAQGFGVVRRLEG